MISDHVCMNLGNTLGLQIHQIQALLYNYEYDITSAARNILHKWLQMKENRIIAWKELAAALRKCDLTICIADILEK